MIQAFIIVFREGFEAFLIVAITLSYLNKSGRKHLVPAVYWGLLFSILASAWAGYLLREGVHTSLWEGILGVVAIILVGTLVVHMWRSAPRMKRDMEKQLSDVSSVESGPLAFTGVLIFTILMIMREGLEAVILMIQIQDVNFAAGVLAGTLCAALLSWAWVRWSYLIDIRRFFQVTGIFLMLFLVQIAVYSVHEFSEAGILPYSEVIHVATEPYSPVGLYGKWFSSLILVMCAFWLFTVWTIDRLKRVQSIGR